MDVEGGLMWTNDGGCGGREVGWMWRESGGGGGMVDMEGG